MFLISGNVLHTVQQEISGGVPRTLVVLCVVWLLSLAVCQGYARHVMGEGYALYAKVLSAGVFDFFAMCSLSYLFDA